MKQKELIENFFESGHIALVGATDTKGKFGNNVFNELRKIGFNIIPVNPKKEFIEGEKCFSSVKSLPSNIENAVLAVPPAETEKVVREALSSGIKRIWMQTGSESDEAINFCEQNNIHVISKKCVLMYAPPVKSFHKFHRMVWRVFGKL